MQTQELRMICNKKWNKLYECYIQIWDKNETNSMNTTFKFEIKKWNKLYERYIQIWDKACW